MIIQTSKAAAIAAVLAGTTVLAGCGAAVESLSEEAVEKAIEQQAAAEGEDVDVEFDFDNDGGEVSIKTDEGEAVISSGGSAEIPSDFPLPVPGNMQVLWTQSDGQGGQSAFLLTDGGRMDELTAFYDDFTSANGEFTRTVSEGPDGNVVFWHSASGSTSIQLAAVDGELNLILVGGSDG